MKTDPAQGTESEFRQVRKTTSSLPDVAFCKCDAGRGAGAGNDQRNLSRMLFSQEMIEERFGETVAPPTGA
jgi:hypothetical protein